MDDKYNNVIMACLQFKWATKEYTSMNLFHEQILLSYLAAVVNIYTDPNTTAIHDLHCKSNNGKIKWE